MISLRSWLVPTFTFSAFLSALLASVTCAQDKYAVLIGVESYDPSILAPLDYTEDDALSLSEAFTTLGFKTKVMTGQSRVSTGKPTSPAKILRVLKTQMNNCAEGDTMVVSLSGHGLQFKSDKANSDGVRETYFCPEDADTSNKSTLLPISDVLELLRQCKASRKLFFVDACRNEFVSTSGQKKAAVQLKLAAVHETNRKVPGGMSVVYSCGQDQFSYEDEELGHSVFTYFIVNYLKGRADPRFYDDDELNIDNLTLYIRKKTNEYVADNISASGQTPIMSGTSADWSLGTALSPVRKILNRHIKWRGGLDKISKIKTIKSSNRHTYSSQGSTVIYTQEIILKDKKYYVQNFQNGQLLGEFGNSFDSGWSRDAGSQLVNYTKQEREFEWFKNHSLVYKDSNGGTIRFFFSSDGALVELESTHKGETSWSKFSDYKLFNGVKLFTTAKYTITGQADFQDIDRVVDLKINPAIDDSEFKIPQNSSTMNFDVDALVNDYNMFKQEYAQPYMQMFQGLASGIDASTADDQTILIDIKLTNDVPSGTNLSAVSQLVPELKQLLLTNFTTEERQAIQAGLVYKFRFVTPNGFVPIQFSVDRNNL